MEAIVFAGVNALDSNDIRHSVLRIPEVSMRLKQAQKIIDENSHAKIDLNNYVSAGDDYFVSSLAARSLVTAVVQIGLFERFLRYHSEPQFYIGSANGESALNYVSQKCSFEELIMNSQLICGSNTTATITSTPALDVLPIDATQLAGAALIEYAVLNKKDGAFLDTGLVDMELSRLILQVVEKHSLQSIVNIGPGGVLMTPFFQSKLEFQEVRVLESIELDPMLSFVLTPVEKTAWA